jgi:hypothetical protein
LVVAFLATVFFAVAMMASLQWLVVALEIDEDVGTDI